MARGEQAAAGRGSGRQGPCLLKHRRRGEAPMPRGGPEPAGPHPTRARQQSRLAEQSSSRADQSSRAEQQQSRAAEQQSSRAELARRARDAPRAEAARDDAEECTRTRPRTAMRPHPSCTAPPPGSTMPPGAAAAPCQQHLACSAPSTAAPAPARPARGRQGACPAMTPRRTSVPSAWAARRGALVHRLGPRTDARAACARCPGP